MSKKKYIGLGLLLLILLAGGYGYLEFNRTRGAAADKAPQFTVEASSLLHEFSTDESAANKKYGGLNLVVQVRGMVKGVETNERGEVIVLLGDTTSMGSVRCAVDSLVRNPALQMTRGSMATMKGYFNGYKADFTGLLGADIELNECVPVK